MSDDTAAPAVDASTVVLVRDGEAGDLEVLLVERHRDSEVAGGALVFPGGKVDPEDRELPPDRWRGPELSGLADVVGTATDADTLGLLVAAVRETFEEAGVLLARHADGSALAPGELDAAAAPHVRRGLVSRDGTSGWVPWLADLSLVLDLEALHLWAWWVTPSQLARRFDTRFWVARLPDGQRATGDEVETTSLRWVPPAEALAEQRRGEVSVLYPTRRNLQALAAYPTADAVLRAARTGAVDRRRIAPTIRTVAGRRLVEHPDGGPLEPI